MAPVDYESMLAPNRITRIGDVLSRRTRSITLLLENLHDPHNAAACLRSAESFGVQDVHVIEGLNRFKPGRRVVQGADKWLDVERYGSTAQSLTALRKAGYRVYVSDLSAARPIHDLDFSEPCALAFGNEHLGASQELIEGADACFVIPMRGFCESFNVSVAVALSLFYAVTRRFSDYASGGDMEEEDQLRLRKEWIRRSVNRLGDIEAALR